MRNEQNREVAIRLSGVKKKYKLGQIGGGTLTADLQSWWARVRGKEDPNTMIVALLGIMIFNKLERNFMDTV